MKSVLYQLFSKISEIILRFPIVVASSVGICIVTIYLTDHYNFVLKENFDIAILEKFLIVLILGFFLTLAIDLYSERQGINSIYPTVPASALLWRYFSSLPPGFDNFRSSHFVQFFLLLLASALLVMTAPFLGKGSQNGFWQYNRKLLTRFIFTIITMGTIYIGLAFSSQTAGYLLSPHFDLGLFNTEEGYFWAGISAVVVMGTLLFLSGIPKNFDALDEISSYPKLLGNFSKFILAPIVTLYAVILCFYVGKLLITNIWPESEAIILILFFSIFGIITLALLYPESVKNKWIRLYYKLFYILLIPLAILLSGSIYSRVAEYGLTVRYSMVIILAFWLLGLSFYSIFNKNYNIKIILISFMVITLVSSIGPLSVFSISQRSQAKRLQGLLEKNGILIDGKINKIGSSSVSEKDAQNIGSILGYLYDIDGLKNINSWFDQDINVLAKDNSHYWGQGTKKIMALMGVDYICAYRFN